LIVTLTAGFLPGREALQHVGRHDDAGGGLAG
jgi:hypothetical protein